MLLASKNMSPKILHKKIIIVEIIIIIKIIIINIIIIIQVTIPGCLLWACQKVLNPLRECLDSCANPWRIGVGGEKWGIGLPLPGRVDRNHAAIFAR